MNKMAYRRAITVYLLLNRVALWPDPESLCVTQGPVFPQPLATWCSSHPLFHLTYTLPPPPAPAGLLQPLRRALPLAKLTSSNQGPWVKVPSSMVLPSSLFLKEGGCSPPTGLAAVPDLWEGPILTYFPHVYVCLPWERGLFLLFSLLSCQQHRLALHWCSGNICGVEINESPHYPPPGRSHRPLTWSGPDLKNSGLWDANREEQKHQWPHPSISLPLAVHHMAHHRGLLQF